MCDQLKAITLRVNEVLGTTFNTILLNKYKDGEDCIGYHRDRETGWAEGTSLRRWPLELSATSWCGTRRAARRKR